MWLALDTISEMFFKDCLMGYLAMSHWNLVTYVTRSTKRKKQQVEVNLRIEECCQSIIEAFWPPLASRFSWTLSRLSSRTSAMYWATFFTTLWRRSQRSEKLSTSPKPQHQKHRRAKESPVLFCTLFQEWMCLTLDLSHNRRCKNRISRLRMRRKSWDMNQTWGVTKLLVTKFRHELSSLHVYMRFLTAHKSMKHFIRRTSTRSRNNSRLRDFWINITNSGACQAITHII